MAIFMRRLGFDSLGQFRLSANLLIVTSTGTPNTYVVGGIPISPEEVGLSLIYAADIQSITKVNNSPKVNVPHPMWDPIRGVLQLFYSGAASGAPLVESGADNISGMVFTIAFIGV